MGQPKGCTGTVTTVLPRGGILGLGKRVVLKVPVVGSVIGWVLGANPETKLALASGAVLDIKDATRLIKEGYQVCQRVPFKSLAFFIQCPLWLTHAFSHPWVFFDDFATANGGC